MWITKSLIWSIILAAPATFLDTRALIEQALDEPAQITLENVSLSDAIARVTEQSGVRLMMAPHVMDLLPHGGDTVIQKAELANVPLRRGLTELFGPLGMTLQVQDDHVAIVPKTALFVLGRPATWAELELLQQLASMHPGLDAEALNTLRSRVQFQVPERDPWTSLADSIRAVGAGPGDDVLTTACGRLGWTWQLSGENVVVTTWEQQTREWLRRPITLRVTSRPLFDALDEIGRMVNVPIRIEGAPPMPRSYSINVTDAPAERVLDKIAAETGLTYIVDGSSVVFYATNGAEPRANGVALAAGTSPTGSGAPDPWFCKIVIKLDDGTQVEFPLRESEVPAELRSLREQAKNRVFEIARQELSAGK